MLNSIKRLPLSGTANFVSSGILERLIELVRTSGGRTDRCGLTDRQFEVAVLYAEGVTRREIAVKLDMPIKTVEVHITAVRRKLNASSSQEVKQRLMESGLLPPQEPE